MYHKESGILSNKNFTQEERNFIKKSTNKLIINSPYGFIDAPEGGSEPHMSFYSHIEEIVVNYDKAYHITVEDDIFLLSVKEFYENVWKNRYILGDEYYIGRLSKVAIENNPYDSTDLVEGNKWLTTLRTPLDLTSNRSVYTDGTIGWAMAGEGHYSGVRPAMRLKSSDFIDEEGSPILLSDKILTLKAFDGK